MSQHFLQPPQNKTVVKMKDVFRILNDPNDHSMRWITHYKIWFDWDAVVRKHGFSTSRKNFLHNLRTNYRWRQTCACKNDDECPPNCRKGYTEDYWMHDGLKSMKYATLMDIPKKKPNGSHSARYETPPNTPTSVGCDDRMNSISGPRMNTTITPNVSALPPNVVAEIARSQQGISLFRSFFQSSQLAIQNLNRKVESLMNEINKERNYREKADRERNLLRQEIINLKQQLLSTSRQTTTPQVALAMNASSLLTNPYGSQQMSIPPNITVNPVNPGVKNEYLGFSSHLPAMFPYQPQRGGLQNLPNQSPACSRTSSFSRSTGSGSSSSSGSPINDAGNTIDPHMEDLEPMHSMTYGNGEIINPSSADLQLHDSFHDEMSGMVNTRR